MVAITFGLQIVICTLTIVKLKLKLNVNIRNDISQLKSIQNCD